MDKARRPHVVRTWTVERTKVPYRPPQPTTLRFSPRNEFRSHAKPPQGLKPSSGQ